MSGQVKFFERNILRKLSERLAEIAAMPIQKQQVTSLIPGNMSHDDSKIALGDCVEIYFDVDHGQSTFL